VSAVFRCDVSATPRPLPHVWEHAVGSGHAPLALRADWQAHLLRARSELGFRHVRFHGILSDDVGTLVTVEELPLYSFFNADQAFDAQLAMGVRPFVELSFMPRRLASGDATVFAYAANVTPPRDYAEWGALIGTLARHWVDRYGAEEVRRWPFEVWNEPNLEAFWTGTRAEYFELYRHTAEAIKGVDAEIAVGGPATAKNEWIPEFLEFCARADLPADFVSTHHYPTDAFGHPGDDTEAKLAASERSVLAKQAARARAEAGALPLYYTEWNSSSNPRDPLHDEPYAGAFVAKSALEAAAHVDGYAFWVVFHGGFGLLTLHGIPKPTYRALELLHALGTERFAIDGAHDTVDAWVVRGQGELTVLLTNHALPRHPIEVEEVRVELAGIAPPLSASIARVDADHGNPRRAWEEMGSPEYPSDAQLAAIEDASRLVPEPIAWRAREGGIAVECALPPHSVAAIRLELA
jgi:xylan 1,4-beta-xylosidase